MSSQTRLSRAYKEAKKIKFDNNSKFIIFSDCHRGNGDFADDFANNRNIYYHALNHYYKNDFQYIELGDGDELWENLYFNDILEANKNIYLLLQKFYLKDKLQMIFGNHDMVYKNPAVVERNFAEYFNTAEGKKLPLMPNLKFNEGIVLEHSETYQKLFLTHGHQADFMNYVGWKINQFFVRILWKPLQVWGIKDPTSPAKNFRESIKVEQRIKTWITNNENIITIVGHTHRPHFPKPQENLVNYFNDGSCVHPRNITGIEIENGKISLVKWLIDTNDEGVLYIIKEYIETPQKLSDYTK
jgi:predicted phosphodiesterase